MDGSEATFCHDRCTAGGAGSSACKPRWLQTHSQAHGPALVAGQRCRACQYPAHATCNSAANHVPTWWPSTGASTAAAHSFRVTPLSAASCSAQRTSRHMPSARQHAGGKRVGSQHAACGASQVHGRAPWCRQHGCTLGTHPYTAVQAVVRPTCLGRWKNMASCLSPADRKHCVRQGGEEASGSSSSVQAGQCCSVQQRCGAKTFSSDQQKKHALPLQTGRWPIRCGRGAQLPAAETQALS